MGLNSAGEKKQMDPFSRAKRKVKIRNKIKYKSILRIKN